MICLEAFAATGFNDILSGRQPRQDTLKMQTELVHETSENLHIRTRLPARENFVEYDLWSRQ